MTVTPHKLDMCNKSPTTFAVFAVLGLWICPGACNYVFFYLFSSFDITHVREVTRFSLSLRLHCVTEQGAWYNSNKTAHV